MSTLSKVSSVLVDDYSLDFLDMQEACVHIFNSSNLLDFCHSEIEAYMHCHIWWEIGIERKVRTLKFQTQPGMQGTVHV